jgi:hypothetical protein
MAMPIQIPRYTVDQVRSKRAWVGIREWWLAVEVLSPRAYLNFGVEEVWLVDPETATVDAWSEEGHRRISGGVLAWSPEALRPDRIEIEVD